MTEERGTYNLHHLDPDRDHGGLERVGDLLRRLIDQRGWPPLLDITPVNGNRPSDHDPWHGDA